MLNEHYNDVISHINYLKFLYICLFRKRIFILGPAHHMTLPGCAVTVLTQYQTPLYDLSVDTASKCGSL